MFCKVTKPRLKPAAEAEGSHWWSEGVKDARHVES
jgi:hypothetical protein